jgi:GntR family transcriptional regulator
MQPPSPRRRDSEIVEPPLTKQQDPTPDGIARSYSGGVRTSGMWHPRLPGRKPPKLVRGPGVTVHGQIEDWLADAIVTGRLAPGDRLPTEQDLAAWLGVSRMTLRHALAELAQRGLVIRAVGRSGGTFVAEPKVEQDLTVMAGFSEQLRRHGLVAGARVLAATEIKASPAASAALEISVGAPVYEVRRLASRAASPSDRDRFPAEHRPGLPGYRLDGSLHERIEQKHGQRPHRAKESLSWYWFAARGRALASPRGRRCWSSARHTRARAAAELARDPFRGDRKGRRLASDRPTKPSRQAAHRTRPRARPQRTRFGAHAASAHAGLLRQPVIRAARRLAPTRQSSFVLTASSAACR